MSQEKITEDFELFRGISAVVHRLAGLTCLSTGCQAGWPSELRETAPFSTTTSFDWRTQTISGKESTPFESESEFRTVVY